MIKRLYIDTSVFGGYFDQEFKVATGSFFHKIKTNKLTLLISSILELEIYQAPQKVIDLLESFPAEQVENIDLTDEVKALAEKYVIENVVGKSSIADCQHIALATIYRADVLASWNFKHIVNLERIRGYNSINVREGYQMIEIRTPKEIFKYED